LALRKIGVAGSADITLSKSEAQGLVEGLKGEMNSITGQQASEARDCMRPYIDKIISIILREESDDQAAAGHLYDEAYFVGEWQWVVGIGYVKRLVISRKTEENVNSDGDVWYAIYAGQIQFAYENEDFDLPAEIIWYWPSEPPPYGLEVRVISPVGDRYFFKGNLSEGAVHIAETIRNGLHRQHTPADVLDRVGG
jgi:hypothetical protein